MPSLRGNVTRKALAEGWQFRQRNSRGGGREYAYDSLPAQTQAALPKPDRILAGSLDLNFGSSNEMIKWNELPVPIKLAPTATSVIAVEEIDNQPSKTFNQVPKTKFNGGLIRLLAEVGKRLKGKGKG